MALGWTLKISVSCASIGPLLKIHMDRSAELCMLTDFVKSANEIPSAFYSFCRDLILFSQRSLSGGTVFVF